MRAGISTRNLPVHRPANGGPEIVVAISAQSRAVRQKLEELCRVSGVSIAALDSSYDVLLLAGSPAPLAHKSLTEKVCLIYSEMPRETRSVSELLASGFFGILGVDISAARFRAALEAIRSGIQVIDPAVAHVKARSSNAAVPGEELTSREGQVLCMLAEGLTNKEISARLSISTHTVKFHISAILGKFGAASRTEAVSIGIKRGKIAI